jgi:D-alanyl-D-alanine carboxypeptidase
MLMHEIDHILKKEVEENKTPSVQYLLFNKDNVIHTFRFGLADIKNQTPVDENTTYNVYSVTKTFTALAILQLAEQNKVDIRKPIKDYLPGFRTHRI